MLNFNSARPEGRGFRAFLYGKTWLNWRIEKDAMPMREFACAEVTF